MFLLHVFLPVGYHAAHATFWVFHIAPVPWNHMDVDVRHRLTCCRANIDTDVVTIRLVLFIDDGFHFIDQRPDSRFFFCRRLKVLSDVPAHDNQAMTAVNRVAVIVGIRQLILDNSSGLATKNTILV